MQDWQEVLAKRVLEEALKAKGDPDNLLPSLPQLRITFNDTRAYNIYAGVVHTPLYADLDMCVFKSVEKQEFVLGDDPVILTNKFLKGNAQNPISGIASRGLIVFLPISSTRLLVMYDRETYRIKPQPLSYEEVVEANIMQVSFAYANVYFRDRKLVEASCNSVDRFIRIPEAEVQTAMQGGRKGILIRHETPSVRLGTNLEKRFVIRGAAKRNSFAVGNSLVRDPDLARMVSEFGKDPAKFRDFLSDGPVDR